MRIATYILIIFSASFCSDNKKTAASVTSKWLILKDSFFIQNLSEFRFDEELYKSFKSFHKIDNKLIDSTISSQWGNIYLYSWQQRDTAFIEFTTIIEEEDRGVRIVYYVFDKKDNLLSSIKVAAGGMEAEYNFETYSKFKSKDTLFSAMAMTQWYDMRKREKLKKTKGDTSIIEVAFRKDGTISKRTIVEKNELNLDE